MTQTIDISRQAVEDFLVAEAELLDECRFEEWHALFTEDARYIIPLNDDADPRHCLLIVNDDALRLEERVYHAAHIPFPSQSPRSRTLHIVGSVRVRPSETEGRVKVLSNQIIGEMRLGDFRQVGLGDQRFFAAQVEHELVVGESGFRIAAKCVRLLNRGATMSNLTFLL